MQFIYAEKLKEKFDVFGHFYDLKIGKDIFNCRSILEIVSKDLEYKKKGLPDAVIIMMNPGSSRPLDKTYSPKLFSMGEIFSKNWKKEIVPTRPDNAQYQIMRLMLLNDWKYVKVLNLSDLRNGNSGEFSNEFKRASAIDPSNPHCIVHIKRRNELTKEIRTKADNAVIAAWGSVEVLRNAANELIEFVPNLVGLKLDTPWYKYPSPYIKEQKLNWLTDINLVVRSGINLF